MEIFLLVPLCELTVNLSIKIAYTSVICFDLNLSTKDFICVSSIKLYVLTDKKSVLMFLNLAGEVTYISTKGLLIAPGHMFIVKYMLSG